MGLRKSAVTIVPGVETTKAIRSRPPAIASVLEQRYQVDQVARSSRAPHPCAAVAVRERPAPCAAAGPPPRQRPAAVSNPLTRHMLFAAHSPNTFVQRREKEVSEPSTEVRAMSATGVADDAYYRNTAELDQVGVN